MFSIRELLNLCPILNQYSIGINREPASQVAQNRFILSIPGLSMHKPLVAAGCAINGARDPATAVIHFLAPLWQ